MNYSELKVLVVDDLDYVRNSVCSILNDLGLKEVHQASSGHDAYEKVVLETSKEIPYSAVLCDIHMPQSDGIEFLLSMKADDRFKDIPILMVSSETSTSMIRKVIKLGAASYLLKPFTPEALEQKLNSILLKREEVV